MDMDHLLWPSGWDLSNEGPKPCLASSNARGSRHFFATREILAGVQKTVEPEDCGRGGGPGRRAMAKLELKLRAKASYTPRQHDLHNQRRSEPACN